MEGGAVGVVGGGGGGVGGPWMGGRQIAYVPFFFLLPLPMPLSHILPSRADLVCAVFPCQSK